MKEHVQSIDSLERTASRAQAWCLFNPVKMATLADVLKELSSLILTFWLCSPLNIYGNVSPAGRYSFIYLNFREVT